MRGERERGQGEGKSAATHRERKGESEKPTEILAKLHGEVGVLHLLNPVLGLECHPPPPGNRAWRKVVEHPEKDHPVLLVGKDERPGQRGQPGDGARPLVVLRGEDKVGQVLALALLQQHLNGAVNRIDAAVKTTKEWEYYQNFWRDVSQDLEPYRTEWEVWDEEHKLTGSIDMVFKRKSDGAFVIYDWKRSKEIKEDNKWDKGLGPMDHLPNSNYWHYTLQLNVYRWFLETYYGLKIAEMCIVIFHPNNTNYQIFPLKRLEKEIQVMIECRKRAVDQGLPKTTPVVFPEAECLLMDE